MGKKLQFKMYDDFGKGMNLFTRDSMLRENESPLAYNVIATGKNSITKRPGVALLCNVAGASKVDGIGAYYAGATRKIIVLAGGFLWDVSSGTAVKLTGAANTFTAGNRADFCQAGGKLYVSNGVEAMVAYDGTNVVTVTGAIIAKYMIFYKGALWAWGNPVAGNETRLYRSGTDVNIGNFTYQINKTGTTTSTTDSKLVDSGGSFSAANVTVGMTVLNVTNGTTATVTAIDSGTTLSIDKDIFTTGQAYSIANNPMATSVYVSKSDGQYLKAAFKHQDYLYVVKERSLWRANVGTDAYGLITLEMIDPARGCDSHHSVDAVDNDNFMFQEQGIFATGYEPNILDQIRTNIVSLRIDPDLKTIQKSRLENVEGMYFDNHYYLSYTSGGGSSNDVIKVYDRQRLGWWEFQIAINGVFTGANCFAEYKNASGETKLYFGSPVDGSVYYFDQTVKQDAGYAIITDYKTGKWSFGDYSQEKFFLEILLYFGKTPGNPTINVYVDGSLAATKTIPIGTTGYAGEGIEKIGVGKIGVGGGSLNISDSGGSDFVSVPIGMEGRNIQIEITDEDLTGTKSWELNAIHTHYVPLSQIYQPNVL
jgi:hypothetical protein